MNELYQKERYCLAFSAFFESPEKWRAAAGSIGLAGDMDETEYDALLRGTDADVYLPLWASAAKGEGKPLMDETTLALISFCHENGFEPRRVDGNPPDYLGEQFRFLAYLYNAARAEREALAAAAEFEDRFTVDTVRAFGTALRRYRRDGEAIRVLEQMERFLRGGLNTPETEETPTPARRRGAPIPTEAPRIVHSAGINNCGGKCKINITVAEGCALEISTDDTDNAPQIRACVRGRGYRHTFLTPRRLRYPMLRTGERGEGKFRRISWDEAARRIAEAVRRIGRDYAPEARYFIYATGNCGVLRADHMMKRLLNMDGGYLDAYNSYSSACSTYVEPFIYGDSYGGNSERDVVNSKLLILWGHNPTETIFGSLRNYYLAQAKAKGIPVVVIDPRESDTALALADEWIPLRPSTDGALADAMAYVIVKNGLHDPDFLHRFCVGFDEESMPEGVPREQNYLAYLTGKLDGTAKTPEWGERITGVPAETITRLALRYAETKPAAILPGFGPQRHGNGEQGTRALAALACLTGNVGVSGGSAGVPGFCPPRAVIAFPQGEKAFPGRIPTFQWSEAVRRGRELTARDGLQGVDSLRSDVKLLFNLAGNTLINQHSDINATARLLREKDKCELIVVSDLFMTASARFADILLPAPSVLESDNITMPWANDDYLLSNTRAVEPLFGAIPDYEWVRLVARHMGLEDAFTAGHATEMDWLRDLYAAHRKAEPTLPPYEEFRARGGFQYRDAENKVAYRDNIEKGLPFATPSGKIELFSRRLYELHDPDIPALPCYHPAPEGPDDPMRRRFPLQLIGYHTKRRCHSIHDQNDWLEEVDPPALWIHPDDAAERHIADGQPVEVFNDRGVVRIKAKVTGRIMRGVTAMSQGGWYTPDKNGTDVRGSINVLTAHRPTPLAHGNPQHTNLVEVRPAPER